MKKHIPTSIRPLKFLALAVAAAAVCSCVQPPPPKAYNPARARQLDSLAHDAPVKPLPGTSGWGYYGYYGPYWGYAYD